MSLRQVLFCSYHGKYLHFLLNIILQDKGLCIWLSICHCLAYLRELFFRVHLPVSMRRGETIKIKYIPLDYDSSCEGFSKHITSAGESKGHNYFSTWGEKKSHMDEENQTQQKPGPTQRNLERIIILRWRPGKTAKAFVSCQCPII